MKAFDIGCQRKNFIDYTLYMRSSKTSLDSKGFNFLIALIKGDAEFFGCLVIHGAIVTGWEAGRKKMYIAIDLISAGTLLKGTVHLGAYDGVVGGALIKTLLPAGHRCGLARRYAFPL